MTGSYARDMPSSMPNTDSPPWLRRGRAGADLTSPLDPRLAYRVGIESPLQELARSAWALVEETSEAESLHELLRERGIGPAKLRALGFSNAELQALSDDRLVLSHDEVGRLAELLGETLERVWELAPHGPRSLVLELHTPPRRRQLVEAGARQGHGPAEERRVALRALAMAGMRTAPRQGEPDWSDALDKWFSRR